jgi:hypothetical protein
LASPSLKGARQPPPPPSVFSKNRRRASLIWPEKDTLERRHAGRDRSISRVSQLVAPVPGCFFFSDGSRFRPRSISGARAERQRRCRSRGLPLAHGTELQSLYAHLSSIGVQRRRKRADRAGAAAEPSLADGDHLIFTLLLGGRAVTYRLVECAVGGGPRNAQNSTKR